MLVPKAIVGKILRGEATLVFRPAWTRRPRVGERLYVKARQKDEVACHVTVLEVDELELGSLAFEQARACGYRTTADAKTAWVEAHDRAWVEKADEECCAIFIESPEDTKSPADLLAMRVARRFDTHWALKPAWIVSFELDTSEQPIMLMQGSPLTDGGKARLMSNRKLPPGRAKSPTMHKDSPEARGYTQSGPRAMPREAEPVDIATVERFAKEGHQGWAARELQRQADRDRMGLEERLRLARVEAKASGADIYRQEEAILRRIKAIENKARRRT